MTPSIPALRAALAASAGEWPWESEEYMIFGSDGGMLAEFAYDAEPEAALAAAAVNALPGLLDDLAAKDARIEKLERVAEAVVEYLEPSHPMKRRQGIAPLLAALADLDGGKG